MNTKSLKFVIAILFFAVPAVGKGHPNDSASPDLVYHQKSLQGMADNQLCLFDNMPSVRVLIRDHEQFKKENLRAFFSYFEGWPTVIVNPKWMRQASYLKMENIVTHELIHAWINWQGLQETVNGGHGELFLRKAMEIGLDVRDTVNKYAKLKPIYKRLKKERESSHAPTLAACKA